MILHGLRRDASVGISSGDTSPFYGEAGDGHKLR
jgi:hypothetical protein